MDTRQYWLPEEEPAEKAVFDNSKQALIVVVNHPGDSDSTGAVTGNIIGVEIGYNAIPLHFKENLELVPVILHIAEDIYKGDVTKYEIRIAP